MARGKADFHTRTQTICTIIQTVVIVVGVLFAIIELNHWTADRDQQRREKAFELLAGLNQELVREAVELVNATRVRSFYAGMPGMPTGPAVSEAEFDTRTEPLTVLFGDLELCLKFDLCDRVTAAASICTLLQSYHEAWIETRSARPSQAGEKWWKMPGSTLFDICPSVRDALSKFYEFTQ
jgi:hypothetical protein